MQGGAEDAFQVASKNMGSDASLGAPRQDPTKVGTAGRSRESQRWILLMVVLLSTPAFHPLPQHRHRGKLQGGPQSSSWGAPGAMGGVDVMPAHPTAWLAWGLSLVTLG